MRLQRRSAQPSDACRRPAAERAHRHPSSRFLAHPGSRADRGCWGRRNFRPPISWLALAQQRHRTTIYRMPDAPSPIELCSTWNQAARVEFAGCASRLSPRKPGGQSARRPPARYGSRPTSPLSLAYRGCGAQLADCLEVYVLRAGAWRLQRTRQVMSRAGRVSLRRARRRVPWPCGLADLARGEQRQHLVFVPASAGVVGVRPSGFHVEPSRPDTRGFNLGGAASSPLRTQPRARRALKWRAAARASSA